MAPAMTAMNATVRRSRVRLPQQRSFRRAAADPCDGGAVLIDGAATSLAIRDLIRRRAEEARVLVGRRPCLAVVLVGERQDSAKYVAIKQAAAKQCNIDTIDVHLPSDVHQVFSSHLVASLFLSLSLSPTLFQ